MQPNGSRVESQALAKGFGPCWQSAWSRITAFRTKSNLRRTATRVAFLGLPRRHRQLQKVRMAGVVSGGGHSSRVKDCACGGPTPPDTAQAAEPAPTVQGRECWERNSALGNRSSELATYQGVMTPDRIPAALWEVVGSFVPS